MAPVEAPPGAGDGTPPRASRRRVGVAVVVAAVAAGTGLLVARRRGWIGGPGPGTLLGEVAPDFTLPALGGSRLTLSALRGHPLLLNFWATWCAPCKDELPELELLYRDHQEEGLVVLAVSEDDDSSFRSVRPYVRQGSPRTGAYTFPVVLDTEQEAGHRYRLVGLPGSFFVDAAGVIRAIQPGQMSRQRMQQLLATILPPGG